MAGRLEFTWGGRLGRSIGVSKLVSEWKLIQLQTDLESNDLEKYSSQKAGEYSIKGTRKFSYIMIMWISAVDSFIEAASKAKKVEFYF